MENKRNYYRLLHVQFDAPEPVIKGSYRTMMQKMRLHPDLGGDEANAQLLNQALATLLNPEKRALYDQSLIAQQPEFFKPRQSNKPQQNSNFTAKPKQASTSNRKDEQTFDIHAETCAFCQALNHRAHLQNDKWGGHSSVCRRCKAPLATVDCVAESSAVDELRRIHRSLLDTSCKLRPSVDSKDIIHAEVLDFSPLGLCIRHQGELNNGQAILIRSDKFACVARVSYSNWQTDGLQKTGLEFLTLDVMMSRGDLFTAVY